MVAKAFRLSLKSLHNHKSLRDNDAITEDVAKHSSKCSVSFNPLNIELYSHETWEIQNVVAGCHLPRHVAQLRRRRCRDGDPYYDRLAWLGRGHGNPRRIRT